MCSRTCEILKQQSGAYSIAPLAYKSWVTREDKAKWVLHMPVLSVSPPTFEVGTAVTMALARSIPPSKLSSSATHKMSSLFPDAIPKPVNPDVIDLFYTDRVDVDIYYGQSIDLSVSAFADTCSAKAWKPEILKAASESACKDKTKAVVTRLGQQGKVLASALIRYEDMRAICAAINYAHRVPNSAQLFGSGEIVDSISTYIMDGKALPSQFYQWFTSRYAMDAERFWRGFRKVTPSSGMKRAFAASLDRLCRAMVRRNKAVTFAFTPTEFDDIA